MLYFWTSIIFCFTLYAKEDLSQLAQSSEDDQIVERAYYKFSYNNKHELANWASYSLETFHLQSCVSRTDNFRKDPDIIDGSASLNDYSGSGFDRGHLVPAGDMKFDRKAMSETFYLSNMTPQPANFNRGKWGSLEVLVRSWAQKYKKIWIITGPILKDNLSSMGRENRISIPKDYYKVILRKDSKGFKGIGLLMNTSVPFSNLNQYTVSIDEIEEMSGIDFFPGLDSQTQLEIEGKSNQKDWDFKASFNYLPCSQNRN